MLFLFLILSIIIQGSFGFNCAYTQETYEIQLEEFNEDEFRDYVDSLPIQDYSDVNEGKCRVEIFIDYKDHLLTINFGDSFPWSPLDYGEGRFDSLIVFNNNSETEIYNVLEYACNDYNECDKLFVFNHIYWLKEINYTLYETHLKSLLLNNMNQTENCFTDKGISLKCGSGVCSGKYSSASKTYFSECYPKSDSLIEVHITTSMIINEEYILNGDEIAEHQIVQYTCRYNQCNNQFLTDQLMEIVKNYFDLSSMRSGLLLYYEEYQNNKTSNGRNDDKRDLSNNSTEISMIEEDNPYNIAHKSFHISINLIWILLIILI